MVDPSETLIKEKHHTALGKNLSDWAAIEYFMHNHANSKDETEHAEEKIVSVREELSDKDVSIAQLESAAAKQAEDMKALVHASGSERRNDQLLDDYV